MQARKATVNFRSRPAISAISRRSFGTTLAQIFHAPSILLIAQLALVPERKWLLDSHSQLSHRSRTPFAKWHTEPLVKTVIRQTIVHHHFSTHPASVGIQARTAAGLIFTAIALVSHLIHKAVRHRTTKTRVRHVFVSHRFHYSLSSRWHPSTSGCWTHIHDYYTGLAFNSRSGASEGAMAPSKYTQLVPAVSCSR
jgi:hypothetical protein